MNKNKVVSFLSSIGALLALWLGISFSKPIPPATPTPTPVATATPSATSFPTVFPTPISSPPDSCSLPPSDGECIDNPSSDPVFLSAVRAAQAEIRVNGVLVTHTSNAKEYTAELAKILRQWGYCAVNTQEDEVWVKKDTNAFSEHIDVVTSNGEIWSKFAALCSPAKF